MTMVETHLAYLVISVGLTIWVARTLRKHGLVYLKDRMSGQEDLADSFSHLLIVGFYLINFGFESLALRLGSHAADMVGAIELLSTKIGFVLLVLGVMHFITMAVLGRARYNADPAAGHSVVGLTAARAGSRM